MLFFTMQWSWWVSLQCITVLGGLMFLTLSVHCSGWQYRWLWCDVLCTGVDGSEWRIRGWKYRTFTSSLHHKIFLPIPFHMHQVVVWQMMFFVNNIFRIKMLLTWNYLTITSSLASISISSCSLVVTKIDFFVYSQLKFWHHYVTLNCTQLILSCNIIFFSGMKTFSTT